ncbi:MAG TPA: thiamine phosphate synthase [Candidatus Binatia bacterium]|nr:thiamine phosphate synthase [Candidatus Binatia bacterium]
MPALPNSPFLCLVTDDELSADRIVAVVESACAAGRIVVQLRARNRGGRELFELAQRLRRVSAENDSLLVVNDRLDVAVAVGADGVHLPASGISASVARALLVRRAGSADRLRIGLSVHSVDEIRTNAAHVDYFQFGPVFATPSKLAYGPPQGVAALAEAIRAADDAKRPLVAVGGIDATNAFTPIGAGAAGIAVIRAVMRASDPGAATRALLDEITRRRA